MQKLALFISGGGTTATAILEACASGGPLRGLIRPTLLISSRKNAGGIRRVLDTGMLGERDVAVLHPKMFAGPEAFGEALIDLCQAKEVDMFGQYGWMVKTPANFIKAFPGMGLNQHPAPLCLNRPDFGGEGMYGRRCHLARLLFVRKTGREFWTAAVAHRVTPEYDKGAILKQERVEILSTDTVETLQARVLPVEHRVQIAALADFGRGTVSEIVPEELVRPGEVQAWAEACEMGKLAYPQG